MSNGRQIGTLVGSLIAAYFTAGTSYAALAVAAGGAIGGAIGGAADPEHTYGQRLDDLKVQVSTYGVPIPILYGTERLGGNVIWCTDRQERSVTERVGKGGGSKNTSYTYYVHMRVLLVERPRDGNTVTVVQLLRDGKLFWDARSGIPVGSALASQENLAGSMTVYQGDPTQLADPLEELFEGVGNVPGYRGVVSALLRDVDCPGGRVPQFSFVLSSGAVIQTEASSFVTVPAVSPYSQFYGAVKPTGVWHYRVDDLGFGNGQRLAYYYGESGAVREMGQLYLPSVFSSSLPFPVGCTDEPLLLWPYSNGGVRYLDLIDLSNATRSTIYQDPNQDFPGLINGRAAYNKDANLWVLLSDLGDGSQQPMFLNAGSLPIGVTVLPHTPYLVAVDATAAHFICVTGGGQLRHYRRTLDGAETALMPETIGPTLGAIDPDASAFFVGSDGVPYVYIVDAAGNHSWVYKITPAGIGGGAWTQLAYDPANDTKNIYNGVCKTFYCTNDLAIYGPVPSPDNDYKLLRFNAVTVGTAKAKDIILDQCARADQEALCDVDAIPDADVIPGYKIAQVGSARTNIDPIFTAFGIFEVDEDGKTVFKKYEAITSVASISYDELGVSEGGDAADLMPLLRKQEIDLPRNVLVSYIDPSFDYQAATEPANRQVTAATETLNINLAICTDSDHAQRIAQTVLFDAWRQQNTRGMSVSRKYAWVSPGDGTLVEYPRGTWKLWRWMSKNDTGALLEVQVEPADSQLFTHTATGAGDYEGQQVSPLPPLTNMIPLNGPILRDQDDNPGLYVVAEGFSDGWRGYTLWMGDDDASLQERGTVTQPCPIGFAESALGNWTPNFIDTANAIVANMGGDVLSSITEASLMTSRSNLAAIGADGRWEFVQFKSATSLGGNRYTLSGWLRGLYGTERFKNTHQAGDKFILINPDGMLRPSMALAELGGSKRYRPVAIGRSLNSVPSQSYANTGVGLLPYSPWDARKSRASNNDQTVTWQRRSRYQTNALRGIVPLAEASESYSIRFYTSGAFTTLAGTLTSATNSVSISSAQQTSFGLTPGATLHVGISQVSASIGAGPALFASL